MRTITMKNKDTLLADSLLGTITLVPIAIAVALTIAIMLSSCFDDTALLQYRAQRQKMLQCIKLPEDHDQKLSFIHSLRSQNFITSEEVIYLLMPRTDCVK